LMSIFSWFHFLDIHAIVFYCLFQFHISCVGLVVLPKISEIYVT